MRYLFKSSLLILAFSASLVSCRNNAYEENDKAEVEKLMDDPDNKVEVKDGGDKIKIETEEGDKIKIKKDDGEYKKKVDRPDGTEAKVKIEDGEVKKKVDN